MLNYELFNSNALFYGHVEKKASIVCHISEILYYTCTQARMHLKKLVLVKLKNTGVLSLNLLYANPLKHSNYEQLKLLSKNIQRLLFSFALKRIVLNVFSRTQIKKKSDIPELSKLRFMSLFHL